MNKFINRLQFPSIFLAMFCLFAWPLHAQIKLEVLDSNSYILGEGVVLAKTSFRGLSVVNDEVIWVSGSRGTFARSTNGGNTFTFSQIKGYEKSDFRDIEGFDAQTAIMMSSGTPAYILKTTDGGLTWKEVFKRMDTAYFLDAMDFWDNKRGMLVGDPINGHFVLLKTTDGGNTWEELDSSKTPKAMEGEAVFAASGTSLKCWGKKDFGFVTGGSISRFISMNIKKNDYTPVRLPLIQGTSSQGAFSFARSKHYWLFTGGDFLNDTQTTSPNFCYSNKINNISRILNEENTKGYKSCIELAIEGPSKRRYGYPVYISTGTSGTETGTLLCDFLSYRFKWNTCSNEPFHTVRKAKKGKAVFLAGPKGKIGRLGY